LPDNTIEVPNPTKIYGKVVALNNVSLEVGAGLRNREDL